MAPRPTRGVWCRHYQIVVDLSMSPRKRKYNSTATLSHEFSLAISPDNSHFQPGVDDMKAFTRLAYKVHVFPWQQRHYFFSKCKYLYCGHNIQLKRYFNEIFACRQGRCRAKAKLSLVGGWKLWMRLGDWRHRGVRIHLRLRRRRILIRDDVNPLSAFTVFNHLLV